TFLGFRLPNDSGKLLRACEAPSDAQCVLPPDSARDTTSRPVLTSRRPALTDARNSDGTECCRRGHPMTPDNRYHWRGNERCRCCRDEARRRWRSCAGKGHVKVAEQRRGIVSSDRPVTAKTFAAEGVAKQRRGGGRIASSGRAESALDHLPPCRPGEVRMVSNGRAVWSSRSGRDFPGA